MKRSQVSGIALRFGGAVLFLIGGAGIFAAMLSFSAQAPVIDANNPDALRVQGLIETGQILGVFVLLVGGAVVTLVGVLVFRYGRRHVIELASGSDYAPTRHAVLYLRDFESDRTAGFGHVSITSEEEQLMKALRQIGTTIAVGRPGEALPQIGAPRIYYNDNEWRDRVGELIRASRLVVIRTGIGDGLRWEVEQIIGSVRPEQLLVAVGDTASLRSFRTWTASVVRWTSTDVDFKRCFGASIRGFLIFDLHWSPTCIKLKRVSVLRLGLFHYREFRSALNPILQRFE